MTMTKKQQDLIKANEKLMAHEKKRIDKIIKSFSASYMSNAKWRKLLALLFDSPYLSNSTYRQDRYRWKFVDSEKIFETPVIETNELDEKYIKDGKNQPFIYREIEWLEVVTDHTKEITEELLKRGQFALDKSENGFKIIAYSF